MFERGGRIGAPDVSVVGGGEIFEPLGLFAVVVVVVDVVVVGGLMKDPEGVAVGFAVPRCGVGVVVEEVLVFVPMKEPPGGFEAVDVFNLDGVVGVVGVGVGIEAIFQKEGGKK